VTQAQRQTASNALDATVKIVTLLGGVLIIAGALWGATAWATGGLRPQTQVASDALSERVKTIQGDIEEIKKRLNEMPGAYEIGAQRAQLGRLDERLGATEKQGANFEARIQALEHPQWRQPH
jgi:chromosome segregation ATPase